jgi:hypothetical protein
MAPRALKEPLTWSCSSLSQQGAAASGRWTAATRRSGVRRTWGAMRAAAAWTSARETVTRTG